MYQCTLNSESMGRTYIIHRGINAHTLMIVISKIREDLDFRISVAPNTTQVLMYKPKRLKVENMKNDLKHPRTLKGVEA